MLRYTPGSDKYKEVLSSANGNITINGKVMAKENVELHGKNITVEGQSNNRAGIIAGVNNQNKLTTQKQAKQIFDSLVTNNIKEAESFSLKNGKVIIKAGSAEAQDSIKSAKINLKNSDLSANEIDITAA